jgi:NADH-quinone oxidoreductase subunit H
MLGCVRAAIQIISYELITSAIFLNLFIITGTTNFELFIDQQEYFPIMLFFPLLGIMNFIAALVETNRPPFDLSEAESDLVAGYNVEYAGILFGLFYLSEYVNLFTNAFIIVIIFFGAWWNVLNYLDNLMNVIFYCFFKNNFIIEYSKIFDPIMNTQHYDLIMQGRAEY